MGEDDRRTYENVLNHICLELRKILKKIPTEAKANIEEIRLRSGKPINVYLKGKDYFVAQDGILTEKAERSVLVNEKHISDTFQLVSNYSVYAFEEEIKNGFITLRGGHRVGIGGKVLYGINGIETIRDISSLNIRIAREKIGVSDELIKYIVDFSQTIHNTLIISPPQCGKTTILRDLIRILSNGSKILGGKGLKVGIIDERSELAGMYNGMPQFKIGLRTDVLDGCNKKD